MGMNVTHFFTGDDLYAVRSAFASPEGLRLFLLVHRPDFISAPLEAAHFPGIISKFPDFALVFFDDTDALYADLRAHPELKPLSPGVDPFRPDLFDAGDARNRPEGPGRLPRWLSGMMAVDPRCAATRLWAAEILLRQAAFGAALAHAEAAAADYPDNPVTHVAVGDALLGLGRGEGALASYREALGRTADAASIKGIRRRMALAWLSLKDAGKAYAEFGRFADPHDPFLGRRDLFHLGILALRAGEERGAAAAFRRLYGPGFRAEGNPAFLADLRRWGPLPGN
jgi:tetratricopeptide (TPR) repeat protein